MQPTPNPAPTRGGPMPQYRILELSYINDRLVGPGQPEDTVFSKAIPAAHWEPLNAAAEEMVRKHAPRGAGNIVDNLTPLHAGEPTADQKRIAELEAQVKRLMDASTTKPAKT